jgi:uncharacterized repeat protein (TIGR01451 family)
MERRLVLSSYVVTDPGDGPTGDTLRWALLQVNADNEPDLVQFNIPGSGVQAIHLASPLPTITNSVEIDGTTQPDYQESPLIQIDGSALAGSSDGLVISAGNSTVEGLAIVGFPGSAIVLNSMGGNLIQATYLGVTSSGTQASPNQTGILIAGSSANTIGGAVGGSANVISGNKGSGIEIETGSGVSTGNEILGNLIGTTSAGTAALGNGADGIEIDGAFNTQIGFPAIGAGNVISGNHGIGIDLTSGASGTFIQNNLIGVAAGGTTELGNGSDGIRLTDAPQSQIGGTDLHEGNVIGGNAGNGISTSGATTGLAVQGNFIGTDATATLQLGNRADGVSLASSSNTIGGTIAGAGNAIEFNGSGRTGAGVHLVGNVDHITILSNSIYQNAGLGINLGDGPTPNHPPGTPGPNDYQNYPVLTLAQSDGTATGLSGTLVSAPNAAILLQFFSSPTPDPTGYGQGKTLINSAVVQTDNKGNASFSYSVAGGVSPGSVVSATATSASGNTSEFSLDITAAGQVNLNVSAAAAPSPVLAGGQLTYTIVVANHGNIPAHGVQLSDQLPNGVTVDSASISQGFFVPQMGNKLLASVGTLAPGGSATMTIVVKPAASSVGTITDSATATSQEPDADSSDNSASVTTTVLAAADLSVALSANPNPVADGSDITYTMALSNLGPNVATGASAVLPLGPTVTFVSASSSTGTVSYSGGQVVASLGDLAALAGASVQVVVQVNAVGSLSETATVSSSSTQDPVAANNQSTAVTQVNPAADLGVSIAADPLPVTTDHDFQYVVTITNTGPDSGSGVVVTDTLPSGVTFLWASSDQGVAPTVNNGVVTLTLATLNAGASAKLTISVDPTALPGASLTDTAAVTGQVADPHSANDQATFATTVRGVSDLAVTATAQPVAVYVGQNLAYKLTVSNLGPADEPDAVLTCPLPASVELVSAASSQGQAPSFAQGLITADLGPLAAGQSAEATFIVTPLAAAAGTLTSTFAVAGENFDPASSNNTAQESVVVKPAADVSVTISPAPAGPFDQVAWTFLVIVSDLGLSNASGVKANVSLPAGAQLIAATSSQGQAPITSASSVSAQFGSITAGASATLTITVKPMSVGSLALAASGSASEFDPNPANNASSFTASVSPSANLTVGLSSQYLTVLTGQSWMFTAIVGNTGPDAATNVVLQFPLGNSLIFDSCTASQGTSGPSAGKVVAQLGTLSPGSTATVHIVVTAPVSGMLVQSATAIGAEYQVDPQQNTGSTTVSVLESPGILQFSTSTYTVPETAGVAQLQVVRTDGAKGSVTVNYQTTAINATPGLDFTPVSGTLSFASGQKTASIMVPVLADPWDNHVEQLSVALTSAGGGATLGPLNSALLNIIDVDPNTAPLRVSQLSWAGNSGSITSVSLAFTAPLDQSSALNPADYRLVAIDAGSRVIPLNQTTYDPATHTVTLVPSAPLASGHFYQLQVIGAGPTAVHDIAGNPLAGAISGVAGSDYFASFAQGTRLQYVDHGGNKVSLKLTGGGYMKQIRDASGDGAVLTLVAVVPHRSKLSGTVRATTIRARQRTTRTSGRTNLGIIQGLRNFGDVKVLLTSPPFYVTQYPFTRKGRGVF